MSRKTSTAALDTSRQRPLRTSRRLPRRPAGETARRISRWRTRTSLAQLAISEEGRVHGTNPKREPQNLRTIVPVMLRITFSLLLWTLGASMTISAAQPGEHHEVTNFPIDRADIKAPSAG